MNKLIALVTLMLAASSCSAATLRLAATTPSQDNAGTCAAPILVAPPLGQTTWMVFSWTGPVSGMDSVFSTPGAPVSLTRSVPVGTYTVTAYARDQAGAGCDTTITLVVKNLPWKPRWL